MSGGSILTAPSEANRSHQPSCYAASLPVFGKVTRRGSNESSGSRHAAGISAILKWNQTCVVNQPVLSSKTSGEPDIFNFEILSAFWLTTQRHFIGNNGPYCQREASLRLGPQSAGWLGRVSPPLSRRDSQSLRRPQRVWLTLRRPILRPVK